MFQFVSVNGVVGFIPVLLLSLIANSRLQIFSRSISPDLYFKPEITDFVNNCLNFFIFRQIILVGSMIWNELLIFLFRIHFERTVRGQRSERSLRLTELGLANPTLCRAVI